MRAVSTSRPASASATAATAPPVASSAPGQRVPLGVPRAGGALVLVRPGGDQRAGVAAGLGGARQRAHRDRGVALVRHGRRPAAGALAHLAHLGLGEQDDVGRRSWRRRPAAAAEGGAQLDQAMRSVCHGATGSARPSSRAYRPPTSGPRSPSAASEPTAPPSWARSRSLAHARDQRARLRAPKPAGRLQPERRRHGLLHQRAAGDRASAGARGPGRRSARPPGRATRDQAERAPGDQHRSAVDDVLARRAEVDEARRLGASPARIARTSGSAGLPAALPSRHSCSMSYRSARQRSPIVAGQRAAGTTPAIASALTSARSASSMAASHA